jgi:hypothetical protein
MTIRTAAFAIGVSVLVFTARVDGHHHVGCVYDTAASQTVIGRIVAIVWEFPHVHIRLDVASGSVARAEWDIESVNPQGLRRSGVASDTLKVGDLLTVTGWVARSGGRQAFTHSMVLPNGKTVEFPIADLTCPF